MNGKNMTWKHEHIIKIMLGCDYDAALLKKKEASKKEWSEVDFMPINWYPFYDTSYDINQIT